MSSFNYRENSSTNESLASDQSAAPTETNSAHAEPAEVVSKIPVFPEIAAMALTVPNVGPHVSETDIETGNTRKRVLMPFALARLGRPYQVWDAEKKCLVGTDADLPLKPHVKELSARLGCGTDLVFQWVNLMCEKGPENVLGDDLLKTASSGGKGGSRLPIALENDLEKAVYKVCVTDGLKPASKAANNAVRKQLLAAGHASQSIATATIRLRSSSPKIAFARTEAYQRDHMMRVAGQPDETVALNSVVVMDTTLFSDDDASLRVVDAAGRDLGAANVIFAILKSVRGIWSFRSFVGPQNTFLAGLTIKRGLVSKDSLLERYGINGVWPFHGNVSNVNHDCGSEFVGAQLRSAIKRRDIGIDDRSPPKTPHYRGDLERFNRTAHVLFDEFLASDCGKRYLRPVNGRPTAKGILLADLDKALTEWIVCHYHTRPHAGLGGDTPLGRWEKFVRGENGLPASGLPMAVPETDELVWDFLWEETRTVNHLGIQFRNRRYVHPELNRLFKLNSRSSECKITFRFNPYAMRYVYVKAPDDHGGERILTVEWLPETEKHRPSGPNQQASINPSLWEWDALFADIRRGNTKKATPGLAEELFAHRESNAAAGKRADGAPNAKERLRDARHRGMRESYGQENVPDAGQDTTAPQSTAAKGKRAVQQPRLLETAAGAEAY